MVVDARAKHLPILLANAAARRYLSREAESPAIVGSSLYGLLGGESASGIEALLASADARPITRPLTWRLGRDEVAAVTELKMLDTSPGQRLGWVSFSLSELEAGSARGSSKSPGACSEDYLRSFIEKSPGIVAVATPDGSLKYASTGARSALGLTPQGLPSTGLFDLVHPDEVRSLRAKYERLTNRAIEGFSEQHRVRQSDGTYRWLDSSYTSANPLIEGVVIHGRDITEYKQAESEHAEREEVFRLAADAVEGIIFEWDLTQGRVHRSRGVREILGFGPDDIAPVVDAWRERIHPQDLETVMRQIGLALIEGSGWTSTYRIRDARGQYRSMLERGLIQRNANGDPVRAIGCCVDVSEIRRLTDLLSEAQRAAKMGGWEYNFSTRELTWTDEMFRIYETARDELFLSWDAVLSQLTPESQRRFRDAWKAAESTDGQLDLELEITTFKNQRIWVRMVGHIERLNGRMVRAFGSVQNIQAQKLAQMALEDSTRWLKLSMNVASMHAWRWDKQRDSFEFAVLDRDDVHGPRTFSNMKELMARMHPEDRASLSLAIEEAFKNHAELHAEFRLEMKKGGYRSYETIARPLFDAGGSPHGLVGVTQDVTARRCSEAKLRRSEQLLRTTTSNTADTLLLVDTDLKIRFINRPCAGMTIEQIVGREISELFPERAHAVVEARLRHVLGTGEATTYEFERREEGREAEHFENRAVFVQDEIIGPAICLSITNITERKRLEQEILDVSSRERHTIGRDLHDGLGQELTGVALMLRGLATRYCDAFPACVAEINEIVGLVNQSIESARSLARGLLPVRAESGGLPFALRELAARSRDLYGLEVDFRADIWPQITLSDASASHLYRIAQEGLTNAARHGHATKVEILLIVNKGRFSLRITDDGVGIGKLRKAVPGMGLKTMRYRAGMIGAKIEIGPHKPRGTVVSVTGEQPPRADAIQWSHAAHGGISYGR